MIKKIQIIIWPHCESAHCSDEIYSIGCCSGVSLSDSFVARVFLSTKFHSSVGASTNNIRFGVFVKVVVFG